MLHQAQPKPLLAAWANPSAAVSAPCLALPSYGDASASPEAPRGAPSRGSAPASRPCAKQAGAPFPCARTAAKVPFPEAKAWAEPLPPPAEGNHRRGRPQYATSPFPAARRPSSRGTTQTRQATRERHRSRKRMGASAKQRFEARGYPEVLGSGQQPIQESLLVPSIGSIQKETKTIHFNTIKEQEKTTLSSSTSCRRMCRKGGFPCLSNVIHNA